MANSAGCVGCHQAGYKGAGTQPRLAGQIGSLSREDHARFPFRRARQQLLDDGFVENISPEDIAQMARVLAGM